jgi:hypothetical protein
VLLQPNLNVSYLKTFVCALWSSGESLKQNNGCVVCLDFANAPEKSLQFSANYVLVSGRVPRDVQYVGFAADLAILDVALFFAGRRIHYRLIPLAASRALEPACHQFCPAERQIL